MVFLLLVECCEEDLPVYSELATEYVSGVIMLPRLAGGSGEVLGNLDFVCFGLGKGFEDVEVGEVFLLGVTSPCFCKLVPSIPPPSFELGFLVRFYHYILLDVIIPVKDTNMETFKFCP